MCEVSGQCTVQGTTTLVRQAARCGRFSRPQVTSVACGARPAVKDLLKNTFGDVKGMAGIVVLSFYCYS